MPRRAPEFLSGIARRGAAWMPHVDEGAGSPFRQPRSKARSAGNKRHSGGFFFGYFLLATQKKVSRLSGRDPTYKRTVALATQLKNLDPRFARKKVRNLNVIRRRNPIPQHRLIPLRQISKIPGNILVHRLGTVSRDQLAFHHIKKPGKRITGLTVKTA